MYINGTILEDILIGAIGCEPHSESAFNGKMSIFSQLHDKLIFEAMSINNQSHLGQCNGRSKINL